MLQGVHPAILTIFDENDRAILDAAVAAAAPARA